mgnify:CR=1 FL=1
MSELFDLSTVLQSLRNHRERIKCEASRIVVQRNHVTKFIRDALPPHRSPLDETISEDYANALRFKNVFRVHRSVVDQTLETIQVFGAPVETAIAVLRTQHAQDVLFGALKPGLIAR